MTYEAAETSAQDGRPVELYTFTRGTVAQRFTSADRDQAVAGNTYTAAVIMRGRLEQTAEMNRRALTLTVPRDFPIAELYRVSPPSDPVAVLLQRFHLGDVDAQVATLWTGRVMNVAWGNDLGQATITCEPLAVSMRRNGLRRLYGSMCSYVLGGPGCRVSLPALAVAGTVSAVSGVQVQAPEFGALPDGHFDGGVLAYEVGAVVERRFIVAHTGSTLTLDRRPLGLDVAAVAQAMPGCDHTLATCHDKFDNAPNYGGQPYIPKKNPMGGDPIY